MKRKDGSDGGTVWEQQEEREGYGGEYSQKE